MGFLVGAGLVLGPLAVLSWMIWDEHRRRAGWLRRILAVALVILVFVVAKWALMSTVMVSGDGSYCDLWPNSYAFGADAREDLLAGEDYPPALPAIKECIHEQRQRVELGYVAVIGSAGLYSLVRIHRRNPSL